jgi:hypothetical protein
MKWCNENSVPALALAFVLALALALASCGAAGGGEETAPLEGSAQEAPATGDAGQTDGAADAADQTGDATDAAAGGETPSGENAAAAPPDAEVVEAGGALTIDASAVTDQATFYPVTVDGVYMEVLAVRAPDGTVRTALNTCQVCWDSGRGYYIQEADELVCQNCGNRFKTSDVEVVHGGCNPVPITEEYKTIDGDVVTVGYDLLKEAVPLFEDWKS